jgi:hypothetical protein
MAALFSIRLSFVYYSPVARLFFDNAAPSIAPRLGAICTYIFVMSNVKHFFNRFA